MFKYFADSIFSPSYFNSQKALYLFCIGWCLVLTMPFFGFAPYVQTFIHPWRPELAASFLFLITLIYLAYQNRNKIKLPGISRREINFIILPLLAFIFWSGLSMFWATSPKSALYHSLVWSEYLIFYILARRIISQGNGYKAFMIPLVATLLLIGLPAIIEYLGFLVFGDATTLGMRYSKYGELFNTISPLVMIGVLRLSGRQFIFGLLVVLAMWLFIISTLGRTNLILFIGGLASVAGLVFVFRRFRKYRRKMVMIVLAVVVLPLPFHLITLFADKPNVPIVARISDDSSIAYSSDVRKLLKSISIEMFKSSPVCGIGADNYGFRFNEFRVLYAAKNPSDVNLMTAEDEIAERSHSEYFQILAELGTVGAVIFLWFLAGVGLMTIQALKSRRRNSLISLGALAGVFVFLASSLVSSYSFRLVQNGFVFFFVLAVAAKFLLASKTEEKRADKIIIPAVSMNFGYALGIAACLFLAVNCLVRAASVYYSNLAQLQPDIEQAMPYFQTAFRLDGENPTAHYACGMYLIRSEKYAEAVPQLQQAVKTGIATSTVFSYLATAQTLSNDAAGAEKTFAQAVRLYPLSPFVRARYAGLLQSNGHAEESAEQLQIALQINKKEAATWWDLINEGARQASLRAAQDNNTSLMNLPSQAGVYAVLTEREIRFPAEKTNFDFNK